MWVDWNRLGGPLPGGVGGLDTEFGGVHGVGPSYFEKRLWFVLQKARVEPNGARKPTKAGCRARFAAYPW